MAVRQETAWLELNVVFRDRITREVRTMEKALIEFPITEAGEILVQYPDGPHRTVAVRDLLKMEKP